MKDMKKIAKKVLVAMAISGLTAAAQEGLKQLADLDVTVKLQGTSDNNE